MDTAAFMTRDQVLAVLEEFGTPVYVYDEPTLLAQAEALLAFPNAYGLTARFAMKACPNSAIVRLLNEAGLHIDASSGFEVERAIRAGVQPNQIQLTAQQLPANLMELVNKGVLFNACSLHQLDNYGKLFPGAEVSVRINPGLGSGHSNRTNTGGPASSFGIWHTYLDNVLELVAKHHLKLTRMHTHIGSGTDPEVWNHCATLALGVAAKLSNVQTLSLGGGFKVGRMPEEQSADMQAIGARVKADFEQFTKDHGRKLRLELEPGTFLVANAGAIVASVIDVVDTGADGFHFIKVDTGMTEVLRPSLYGAQHPMTLIPVKEQPRGERDYVIAGHCCESGDILTPAPGDPEALAPRWLPEAHIGDALVIGGAGAYCAGMSAKNYNSFPEAPEVMLRSDGTLQLIRKRQSLEQALANEVAVEAVY